MIHMLILLSVPLLWLFGISALLLGTFLVVEVVQHRKTYISDSWSEEALLEEAIASGMLPVVTHVVPAPASEMARPGMSTDPRMPALARGIPH